MNKLWLRLLGRSTLRPQVAVPDWSQQHHEWYPRQMHWPGDHCEPRTPGSAN